jgi:hydroxymethylpyrimidine pyrophosphatase-like HAD family hydrolase
MKQRRALILDLDFTLLHLEPVPGAIEVPGRTRSAFISPATVGALIDVLPRFDLFLATARSWHGTKPVVLELTARGVEVSGVVLEDGGLLGLPVELRPLEPQRDWKNLRVAFEQAFPPECPPFKWQEDFQTCLVARVATSEEAERLQASFAERAKQVDSTLRCFRNGRKVYGAGALANKWKALEIILGRRAVEAVGIGDDLNDLCWLAEVALPCTLNGASPEVVSLVANAGGVVSETAGHEGICELLRHIVELQPACRSRLSSPLAESGNHDVSA